MASMLPAERTSTFQLEHLKNEKLNSLLTLENECSE